MHKVKCSVCGESFDRDRIQAVQTGARRYAHASCDPNNTKLIPLVNPIDPDEESLISYVKQLLEDDYNPARVRKQIKQYKEEGMSYTGMLKSLTYWYEVKGNSKEKACGGIGIIPYIYNDAKQYYYALFLAQSMNENKDIESFKPKEIYIEIETPMVLKRPPRLMMLEDDE